MSSITSRENLTSRIIPQMKLGTPQTIPTSSNPPLANKNKQDASISDPNPAKARFQIHGTAAITGGAGTLALTAARGLLQHGLSGLLIMDLESSLKTKTSETAINSLISEFPSAKILKTGVDVTDDKKVDAVFDHAKQTFGGIDMLLCFAGVVDTKPALEMSPASFRRTMEVNTTGTFLCAQAAAKLMVERGVGGSILFTASISAHRVNFPQPQVAYNTSKAALLTMKYCLAAEWAQYGIRVNSISPGYMDTILNEGEGLAECRSIWNSRNPMGRMGNPEELVGTIVMLCSGAGSYINGSDIVIDGGQVVF